MTMMAKSASECEALCCKTEHCVSYTLYKEECYLRTHGSDRADLQRHSPDSYSGMLLHRRKKK